jgi:DNA-binding HxlR family transcriptional regulator
MVGMSAEQSPLAAALERVGDRWSFLVIDALMDSPLRFNHLSRAVDGIAPNILSDRLRRLEQAGVVAAQPYSQRPLRHEYRLTEDGQEMAGVLRLLSSWALGAGASEGGLHHETCGTQLEARWFCPTCAAVVRDEDSSELRRL